jgi:predicted RNA binding protein YcfA (HicA-like mRNA interferase family)
MKLPRDIGGKDLADLLSRYGYEMTRQTGSYLRLTPSTRGRVHSLTRPNRKPCKGGTLSAALGDVAKHTELEKQDLIRQLFGPWEAEGAREEDKLWPYVRRI